MPICLFAYGTAGLGVASAFASVVILLHFTLGVLLAKKSFELNILICRYSHKGPNLRFVFRISVSVGL